MDAVELELITPPAIEITMLSGYGVPVTVSGGGGGGTVNLVTGESPTGALNGSNATFTTQFNFVPGTVAVYCNGQRLKLGNDFTTSGTQTIQLTFSPTANESITVDYQR